jgi:uncharacterized protein YjdB
LEVSVMRLPRSAAVLVVVVVLALTAACSRKPASIDITPKKVTIYGLEEGKRLTARVLDKKGEPMPRTVNWSTSNDKVVTVDGGRITAKAPGKAQITAQHENLSASVTVDVIDVRTFEIQPPIGELVGPLGSRLPLLLVARSSKDELVALQVEWSSSDPKIAEVSSDGFVTSKAKGTVSISAKVGDLQAVSEIKVVPAEIARIDLRPNTGLIRIGESQKFTILAYSADGSPVEGAVGIFRTENPMVAVIDRLGVATGVSAGTVMITVEFAGKSATATLIVN